MPSCRMWNFQPSVVGRISQVMTNDSETRFCEISPQKPDLTKAAVSCSDDTWS